MGREEQAFLSASSPDNFSLLEVLNEAGRSFHSSFCSSAGSSLTFRTKRQNTLHNPRNDLSFVSEAGGLNLRIILVVGDSISSRQSFIESRKLSKQSVKNLHFLILSIIPMSRTSGDTCLTWSICASSVLKSTTISSSYMSAIFHFIADSLTSIVLWSVRGAFWYPKGMQIKHCNSWWQVTAVSFRSEYTFSISQFLQFSFSIDKKVASPSESMQL